MKRLYNLKNHLKIALTLFVLLVMLILTSFIEKHNLKTIDKGFSSIFADRLVPATDIFFMADQLYERRLNLQGFLLSSQNSGTLHHREQNRQMDSLLTKYQGTYLVEDEVVCLKNLTTKWNSYKILEEKVLKMAMNNDKAAAIVVFNAEGNQLFRSIITDLQLLTKIQSEVGEDLMDTSKSSISSSNSLLTIQSGIILIVAIITYIFLFNSRSIYQAGQKFRLN